MTLEKSAVDHGVKSIETLLNKMKMVKRIRLWNQPEPVYYGSTWVRADQGGILFSAVKLGQNVKKGRVLGTVTDPITNVSQEIVSPYNGKIIGMAENQVVMPGFAAYHIGIKADDEGEPINPQDYMPSGAAVKNTVKDGASKSEPIPDTTSPADASIEDIND